MSLRSLRRFIPLAAALGSGACVDLTGLDIGGGHLISISIDQGAIVEVGDTVRLTATGGVDGLIGLFGYDRLLDARWAVSDPTIAQLQLLPPPPPEDSSTSAQTLIRGQKPGTAHVTATARGITGDATVRVIPVVGTIQLRAPRDTLTVGDTIVVTAAALDAGGVPIGAVPLTFQVSDGLQLRGYDNASAHVIAIAAGPATISARFRRATGEAALVVVSPAP
jgi:hypothetical protein